MAYSSNQKSTGLDTQTTLASNDLIIHGDVSDSGRAKSITRANFVTDIQTNDFSTYYKAGGTDVAVGDGGTNQSSYTKGDILAASGTTTLTKVSIGTDRKVLTADSTVGTGVAWILPTNLTSMTAGATIAGTTIPVPIYQDSSSFKVLACDGNDTSKLKFLGFGISDSTDGTPITVQTGGIVSGFTGLTRGVQYYIQDAIGTIGTSMGTYEVLVGWAISTTEILIMKGKRYFNGSGTFSDAGNTNQTQTVTITCGFRISRVIMMANGSTGGDPQSSFGSWVNNGLVASSDVKTDESAGSSTMSANTTSLCLMTGQWAINIGTVTNTSFVITALQLQNSPTDLAYSWSAEGDI